MQISCRQKIRLYTHTLAKVSQMRKQVQEDAGLSKKRSNHSWLLVAGELTSAFPNVREIECIAQHRVSREDISPHLRYPQTEHGLPVVEERHDHLNNLSRQLGEGVHRLREHCLCLQQRHCLCVLDNYVSMQSIAFRDFLEAVVIPRHGCSIVSRQSLKLAKAKIASAICSIGPYHLGSIFPSGDLVT